MGYSFVFMAVVLSKNRSMIMDWSGRGAKAYSDVQHKFYPPLSIYQNMFSSTLAFLGICRFQQPCNGSDSIATTTDFREYLS